MTPDELQERMDRVLKTTANLHQALKYIETEAKAVITEIANANQMTLFDEDELVESGEFNGG